MKYSYNWLAEFVDLRGISPEEVEKYITLQIAEAEGIEKKGENLSGIVSAEIISCEAHPNSQKLHLLKVKVGEDKILDVVCGAPNARKGIKVLLATIGANVNGLVIEKAKIAGYESNGMCVSGAEIGISNDNDGIIELKPSAKIGLPINEVLPFAFDSIIEVDNKSLTNRPDLWGHYGMARELSAVFDRHLRSFNPKDDKILQPVKFKDLAEFEELPKLSIKIEDEKNCLSYGAIRVDNVQRAKAPLEMQTRLFYCGINAHSFLVDLTNYIMLELGQPMHAFDARKIGAISIGNVNSNEKFSTLKGHEVLPESEILFIKSDGKPVAIAGVMGGKDSEISGDTTDTILEFATFDAASVRKTATKLGIRTDASARYEKSLDPELNKLAAERALYLIWKHDKEARVASAWTREGQNYEEKEITISRRDLERFCGFKIDHNMLSKKLWALGFKAYLSGDLVRVGVPSWRATKDINGIQDIYEEIVRMYGYQNIVPTAPKLEIKPVIKRKIALTERAILDFFVSKGFCEVQTYTVNDSKILKNLGVETKSYLKIVNNSVKGDDELRSELTPSLLAVAVKNKAHKQIRICEIGKVWSQLKTDGHAIEEVIFSALVGSKEKETQNSSIYSDLANSVRAFFETQGFAVKFELGGAEKLYFHPKNNAKVFAGEVAVGEIGIIHPEVAGKIDNKLGVAAIELNLGLIANLPTHTEKATRVSKYPKTTLDFTWTTKEIYGKVEDIFKELNDEYIISWRLKDVFVDEDKNNKYTLEYIVGSNEKTLAGDDIHSVWEKIADLGRSNGLILEE
ncbi:MAG: phenylalanine--tRNA ligase subunit beta [Christensenellaceae bacterium]|jgi:phenylalanyl-tRNA synthetase beta chain|nr:phenylalanine--tRNA ligase subunit beta [Christensenellaceae bacterium]